MEGGHVFVQGGTGEGELEGELFEDFDGAGGEKCTEDDATPAVPLLRA